MGWRPNDVKLPWTLQCGGLLCLGLLAPGLHELDILFVLDNSSSTAEKRRNQALNLGRLERALRGPDGFFNQGRTPADATTPVEICSSDYSPALRLMGHTIRTRLASTCARWMPLTDSCRLAARGCLSRAACSVRSRARGAIPRCPAARFDTRDRGCGGSCPCWRLVHDPTRCSGDRHGAPFRFEVLGHQAGDVYIARCASARAGFGSAALAQLPTCAGEG